MSKVSVKQLNRRKQETERLLYHSNNHIFIVHVLTLGIEKVYSSDFLFKQLRVETFLGLFKVNGFRQPFKPSKIGRF